MTACPGAPWAVPQQRRALILDRVRREGGADVGALSRSLRVAARTIRRDLRALAEAGLVDVVHGGAVAREPGSVPLAGSAARSAWAGAPGSAAPAVPGTRGVAVAPVGLDPAALRGDVQRAIEGADRVGLCAGVGVGEVARALMAVHLQTRLPVRSTPHRPGSHLTVVTNSLAAAAVLTRGAEAGLVTVLAPGVIDGDEVAGPLMVSAVAGAALDVSLIAAPSARTGAQGGEPQRAFVAAGRRVHLLPGAEDWSACWGLAAPVAAAG